MSRTNIKPAKQPGSRRSSILMAILLIPLITLTFLSGIYIGSKFVDGDSTIGSKVDVLSDGLSQGLPGTNNVLRRWSEGNMKYLRGAAAELLDVAKRAEILVGLSPPAPQTHMIDNKKASEIKEDTVIKKEQILKGLSKPLEPNSMYNQAPEPQHIVIGGMQADGHVVSGSQQKEELKRSLHADMLSYMTGPNSLDDPNILVGAWVYLDKSETNDNNMRTIFTNKKSGCTNLKDQYGLSMYVNAWETSNHMLYVEYGGLESGCHKLDSNGVQLHPEQWYHVAVHLGDKAASLYIDGTIVSSSIGGIEKHEVQTDLPLRVGQYDGGTFPLYGNISHLAFVHCLPDWTDSIMGNVVKSMMDLSLVGKIKGLHALYTFSDATEEISGSPAVESVSGLDGIYHFQAVGKKYPGVPINLIDGVDGRPVTKEMRDESDEVSRVRREKVKDGMKHAWAGYKTYAWGRDEVKPKSHVGADPWGGMGVTLVDSLDTLWIMGMKEEFAEARDWVKSSLTFRNAETVSLFEVSMLHCIGVTERQLILCSQLHLDCRLLSLPPAISSSFSTFHVLFFLWPSLADYDKRARRSAVCLRSLRRQCISRQGEGAWRSSHARLQHTDRHTQVGTVQSVTFGERH
jgi:Glycosyl hydrolase family 47/Concanavalin A-like lectin/glucanases superfamily